MGMEPVYPLGGEILNPRVNHSWERFLYSPIPSRTFVRLLIVSGAILHEYVRPSPLNIDSMRTAKKRACVPM